MKKVWLVIFVLVLVVVAYMLWQSKTVEEVSDVDTAEAINQDLNSLNTADLDMEFKDVDAGLNSL
ncbi:MAG: hypothetical protein A3I24_02215 [Candidatus Harrisonbacteria bacterium RIFCSPLOWO2_02_FULL_41_13b]|uniref:Uncharacterized protein n=1 Tax=Candidatus Harrisonbacteria bacterium RIFCSPLOWO2_02_FULL_41_13b TaxID=1798409 RepID=A0A1G1ZUQ4_9BACT|nr:MAG: hypothetical protein A3J53_03520 [Candidatus Harrisonbacteria bacterium RIFCSPHIGHO2_02_FULL_40_20]OGY68221.1 MAG: hypothetical protein A3I24_02215 [Candidatus Harrisonbacteria bacterium RIFCSPLOWO2_02_FULL_41_13b]